MITAALGTLPFIATLWLLVVLGSAILDESGTKIIAALKGRPQQWPSGVVPSRRIQVRLGDGGTKYAPQQLRAAA